MIVNFGSQGTEDIFKGENTASARRVCPQNIWPVALRKLDALDAARTLESLRAPVGNRLERLSGRLLGWHSIRINDRWRIVFRWSDAGPEGVEIVDYHR